MNKQIVANVQILRGVAASLVVWYHLQAMLNGVFGTDFDSPLGAIGVDIFFVISGFIMFYRGHAGPERIPHFLISRFFRIVPLYWMGTIFVVAVFLLGFHPNGVHYLSPRIFVESMFFIPSEFENGRHDLILVLGWTLMYELFFYALFALSFFTRSRVGSFFFVGAVLVGASVLGTQVEGWSHLQMYFLSPITIEFLFGAVLGLTFARFPTQAPRRSILLGVSCLGLAAVMLVAFFQAGWIDLGRFGARFLVFGVPSFFIVLGVLLLEKANVRRDSGALIKWGDISYSLYLFHPLALQASVKQAEQYLPNNPVGIVVASLIAFTVSILMALAIYETIETRLVVLGKRVAKKTLRNPRVTAEAGPTPP